MKKIAVFTSGGDAPGMNAALRAVVRSAIYNGLEVVGIMDGLDGMIDGDYIQMPADSVSNIIQRGGTILKTSRSPRFRTPDGMKSAADQLKKYSIEGMIALGGDGTFRAAEDFHQYCSIPCMGVPCTIDNDLAGTDYTIGFDTAINTVVEAVDKIRDTAVSHNRLFFVEVMGRDSGQIALMSSIASGAEAVLIPESITDVEHLFNILEKGWNRKKSSYIIIVAEGDEAGGAVAIANKVKTQFDNYDTRVTVLGHIQRGGNPSCMDRVNATRLGVAALEALLSGHKQEMVGIVNNQITYTPFKNAVKQHPSIDPSLLKLTTILSA
jgi:6-phosphofructokinase 1